MSHFSSLVIFASPSCTPLSTYGRKAIYFFWVMKQGTDVSYDNQWTLRTKTQQPFKQKPEIPFTGENGLFWFGLLRRDDHDDLKTLDLREKKWLLCCRRGTSFSSNLKTELMN